MTDIQNHINMQDDSKLLLVWLSLTRTSGCMSSHANRLCMLLLSHTVSQTLLLLVFCRMPGEVVSTAIPTHPCVQSWVIHREGKDFFFFSEGSFVWLVVFDKNWFCDEVAIRGKIYTCYHVIGAFFFTCIQKHKTRLFRLHSLQHCDFWHLCSNLVPWSKDLLQTAHAVVFCVCISILKATWLLWAVIHNKCRTSGQGTAGERQ